ncbi:Crotonyl-CoA reductase [bacterium HR40]|nr:Crotonyl-CoA reductase [bacterium HR40]
MSRQNVERIIRKFGSQQRVAELLGIWQTAVSGWIRRGVIPTRRQAELLAIARREGIDLRPEDFFEDGLAVTGTDAGVAAVSRTPVASNSEGSRTMPATADNIVSFPQGRAPAVVRATKDLYEVGEIPPLGHVPKNMYAWVIRQERHGDPIHAMQQEVVPTWEIGDDECLVMVMAAGVNYNGVWAALGKPISPIDVHKQPYHIAGSDASGIVWAVGSKVRRWKVGDEVVIHCNQDDGDDEECNGGDPMFSPSQRIWGYETGDGSFAQFCRVQSRQLMPRPKHLTWEESGCYVLTLATAYRMLFGHPPHTLKPGDNVLVWGGAGGLGSMAIQLIAASGANAIAVISDEEKRDFVLSLGAKGAINRKQFHCWGEMPDPADREAYGAWIKEVRRFGKAIWDITGKQDVDIVFEHPGAATFPVSVFVVKRGGMVVICAGTTGYKLTLDARYLWMRQKRVQGSHFAHLKQAMAANRFVLNRQVDPCMSEVFAWHDIPRAHQKMMKNEHRPGNMAVLVQAKRPGMRTFEEALEA